MDIKLGLGGMVYIFEITAPHGFSGFENGQTTPPKPNFSYTLV